MDKKKKKPTICCLQETNFSLKDTHRTHRLRIKRWEKTFQANGNNNKKKRKKRKNPQELLYLYHTK